MTHFEDGGEVNIESLVMGKLGYLSDTCPGPQEFWEGGVM